MEHTIVNKDLSIEYFAVKEGSYTEDRENRYGITMTPNVLASQDQKAYPVEVRVEVAIWKEGMICELRTHSEFSIEFTEPYDLKNKMTSDISLYIFTQLFLFASGQMQGALRVKTKDTIFDGMIIKARFMEELGPMTKSILLSALN